MRQISTGCFWMRVKDPSERGEGRQLARWCPLCSAVLWKVILLGIERQWEGGTWAATPDTERGLQHGQGFTRTSPGTWGRWRLQQARLQTPQGTNVWCQAPSRVGSVHEELLSSRGRGDVDRRWSVLWDEKYQQLQWMLGGAGVKLPTCGRGCVGMSGDKASGSTNQVCANLLFWDLQMLSTSYF